MAAPQSNIINALLDWLEDNLDQPLSLDDVAAKAGFSKWYLQRMFKYATGHNLGAYTRARRLSMAALALRVTSRPIQDIGTLYHFESQPIFGRAFKRQFAQSPGSYRCAPDWPLSRFCPPIRLGAASLPKPDFIIMPEIHLVGVTKCYSCTLEQIDDFFHHDVRPHIWHKYLDKATTLPSVLYGLNCLVPGEKKRKGERDMIFQYTTAKEPDFLPDYFPKGQSVVIKRGIYAQFTYNGTAEGLQDFIILIYGTAMSNLGLTRRQGQDIEIFYPQPKQHPLGNYVFHCKYLIPIRH
ncbi:helix-turn-helix domain-containing protein [Acerihabitans arboris]|uniref:Helix-turn-helix domain-containing protein n=1 Tax=Acerihabitans arboris TaxID=2691583 RepID=A0A845SKM6_9GAMM|nr:helix-turn-helix domain-containing protein [Acerihabitans arboris]NDL65833.1 helix-turn-helix domain-containing protein [Acerihabitans arboris]